MRIHDYKRRTLREAAADRLDTVIEESPFYAKVGPRLDAAVDFLSGFGNDFYKRRVEDVGMIIAALLVVPCYCKLFVQEYFARRGQRK